MSIFNRQKEEKEEKRASAKPAKVKSVAKPKPKGTKELYNQDKNDKGASAKVKKEKEKNQYSEAYRILIKPLITEKAANLGVNSKYVFAVSNNANKVEIAKSINKVYGINPVRVNIITVKGKKVRTGRILGKRKDWKKAIITLPKGKTIKVYEGV